MKQIYERINKLKDLVRVLKTIPGDVPVQWIRGNERYEIDSIGQFGVVPDVTVCLVKEGQKVDVSGLKDIMNNAMENTFGSQGDVDVEVWVDKIDLYFLHSVYWTEGSSCSVIFQ